ncbi:hypothetical protein FAVG1_04735 [Fusarium avenaceum]|nr:hypothetical protein FAVG1_04735 [Fusarium avenaceum]
MEACICSAIHTLANEYDEAQARELIPALNRHLKDVRHFLGQSKSPSRDVQFQITPRNQRTDKALFVDSVDLTPVNQISQRFANDVHGFWAGSDDRVHTELRRRLACVVIFLRSKLGTQALASPQIAGLFHGQQNPTDMRNPGRKFVHYKPCQERQYNNLVSLPKLTSTFADTLLPPTLEQLKATALKLLCFVCPLCYEGNTDWSPSLKEAVWPMFEKLLKTCRMPASLRTQVIEAVLYFGERDSVAIRHAAVNQAKVLLRKSMPYYLHASVVLFRSILFRVDGDLAKSESHIRDFSWRGPRPVTRRDHALGGRIHISQMENKFKCYDNVVPSFAYEWEAEQPLSTLDMEVTFRLQSTAARYFQSIGDFGAAKASLEQFISLALIKPIRANSRRVLVGRLADVYCEVGEYLKAVEILQPELDGIDKCDRERRGFRRLLLALVDANIGLTRLDAAESTLQELLGGMPHVPDDINDQQLHIRMLLASARISHLSLDLGEAVLRWRIALEQVNNMHTLGSSGGFIAAVIYLSLAHAELSLGDKDGGHRSWTTGLKILASEKCEFWIPVAPTKWLKKVVADVYRSQGWPFRMMLPGGKPDVTQHGF